MSKQCKIIEDLLPLYHDGVCSAESREMIEEHLAQCEKCRKTLGQIEGELAEPVTLEVELEPLKHISKAVNKGKRRALITGVSLALAVVLVLLAGVSIRWYTQEYLYYKDFAEGQISEAIHQWDAGGNVIQSVVVNRGKYTWYDDAYRYNVEVPGFLSYSGRVEMIRLEGMDGEHISVFISRWKERDYMFQISFSGTAQQWLDEKGNLHFPYFIVDGDMNQYFLDHWTQEEKGKMEEDLAIYMDEIQQLIEDAKAMWPFLE